MRKHKSFALGIFAALIVTCLEMSALGQGSTDGNLATMSGGGSTVKWNISATNAGGSLTITTPDGRAFTREFREGVSPEITLGDKQFGKLPDGSYSYELRLRPVLTAAEREALKAARGKDDEPEAERAGRRRPAVPLLVQSGGFAIVNGAIVIAGAVEERRGATKPTSQSRPAAFMSANTVARLANHRSSLRAVPDQVIGDDLIVQGSACIGFDCVNNESFGFDTIRMKENNNRIQFEDTSVTAGFPTNNWQIRANSTAAGGGNFLAFVDQGASGNSDNGTIVFEVDAGAPANSLTVHNTGRIGIKTATPFLDLHIINSNTPGQRLEQTSASGFPAQTWDIAGNEFNFFIRDLTNGSRLPFRIRPGAPTSSIDINGNGRVGIATASPESILTVVSTTADTSGETFLRVKNTASFAGVLIDPNQTGDADWLLAGGFPNAGDFTLREFGVANRMTVKKTTGRVGIGTATPDQQLSVNGDASKTGGNTWLSFSDERLKNIKGTFNSGLKAVMQLQPIRYEYKSDNALGLKSEGEHIGFGAQTLQRIIPEAVIKNADGYLMVNSDPILWTMLNAIKEQQKEIATLKAEVQKLRSAPHRRRR